MPVVAKFGKVIIRVLIHGTFGTHFHAFYGDSELVIALHPLRVVQGEAPPWVQQWALEWVKRHQNDWFSGRQTEAPPQVQISREAGDHIVLAE